MKLLILLLLLNNRSDTTHYSYHWYSQKDERMVGLADVDTSYLKDTWTFFDGVDDLKVIILYKGDTLFIHHYPRPGSFHLYSNQPRPEPIIDTIICKESNNLNRKGDTVFHHHYQYGDFTDEQVREYAKKPRLIQDGRVL